MFFFAILQITSRSGFGGVCEDAAEKTDGTCGRSSAASDDGLSPQILGLDLPRN
jgi:hypothetical protein